VPWIFAVYVSYYTVHKPFTASIILSILDRSADLVIWIGLLLLATAIGHRLWRRLTYHSLLAELTFAAGLGLGLLSLLTLGLGFIGLLHRWLFHGLAALAEDTFWKRTDLREDFILRWKSDHTQPSISSEARVWQDYLNCGWEGHYEGHHEEALSDFGVSILLGNRTEGHMALGRLADQQGYTEKAIGEYEMSVRTVLEPDSYGLFVYRRIGHYQSILPQLPELGFTTTLAESYMELGTLYEAIGELDRAEQAYEIVVEHDPTFQPALERLESLQHSRERTGVLMTPPWKRGFRYDMLLTVLDIG